PGRQRSSLHLCTAIRQYVWHRQTQKMSALSGHSVPTLPSTSPLFGPGLLLRPECESESRSEFGCYLTGEHGITNPASIAFGVYQADQRSPRFGVEVCPALLRRVPNCVAGGSVVAVVSE